MMQKALTQHLVALFDVYCDHTEMARSTLAKRIGLNPRFYERLKDPDAGFTVASYDTAMAFFTANWPRGRGSPPMPKMRITRRAPVRKRA